VAAAAVDVTNFIVASDASKEAFKTATLLKTLDVNALIFGEEGVGKRSLAKYILPDAPVLEASSHNELLAALESTREIVILDLQNSPNIKKLIEVVLKNGVRVVATAKKAFVDETLDEIVSVKFTIPPLSERTEDVAVLTQKFIEEAYVLFSGKKNFDTKSFTPDLSENANSLKRQIMVHYLLHDVKDTELMQIIEDFLCTRLGSNSDYRKFLYLYEVPLINAGLKRYKSQLQLADKLGLNRNTLRKKIAENQKYLEG
jgi:DNA-binding NtrC family response regulator